MTDERAPDADVARDEEELSRGLRAVRVGHGANCSSIGSVVDAVFATAVIGGAVFAAVAAALARERVKVVGEVPKPSAPALEPQDDANKEG